MPEHSGASLPSSFDIFSGQHIGEHPPPWSIIVQKSATISDAAMITAVKIGRDIFIFFLVTAVSSIRGTTGVIRVIEETGPNPDGLLPGYPVSPASS